MDDVAKMREDLEISTRTEKGPMTTISKHTSQWNEEQLFQLSKFYRERLKQAIEERVEELTEMLRLEGHISDQEQEKVSELVGKRTRPEASKVFFSLVMGKGSRARRVMWEAFVKMRNELPKLDRILKEIQELGADIPEYMNISQGLTELPPQLKDVHEKHKKTLQEETEELRVNTILLREKVKVSKLVDRYAELTVISSVRERRFVEHELLARGRDHEEWREKHLRGELEKIRSDQLLQSSFSHSVTYWQQIKRFFGFDSMTPTSVNRVKPGNSAAVAGVPGIGKTTMIQKIVYDWANGNIYQHFHFVFSFKFRDLNTILCKISLRELILKQYPYFENGLGEVWKNPEGLLFIFDGLDELKDAIDFTESQRDADSQRRGADPEFRCHVSDIVYNLIQHKLLPGYGRFDVFLRFVAGLSSGSAWRWKEFLGPFPADTARRVIDFVKREIKRLSGNTKSEDGKRSLLNTLHYLFESQNRVLAQDSLGSVEKLSLSGLRLTPIDCAVLSHVIGFCDTVKHLDLDHCYIQCEGLQRLAPYLHRCQELGLGNNGITDSQTAILTSALVKNSSLMDLDMKDNRLGNTGVKQLLRVLNNSECKIQKLGLKNNSFTASCAKNLACILRANQSLIKLEQDNNKLEDSGVKLLSEALRNHNCKI
ncbi:NACHT, LRR and PYD domains-containing protein 3-like [Hypanus sabinus]|uniref:NACHT, LRR and PYD domains-containing protein 3-like n=1 Tax=Hypanus sabinus TaxID=79690 RepID=UPI0028C3F38D|nr:NACHT, LRR and PYD domains-containing protein 3-like [Hypanus sabinus]